MAAGEYVSVRAHNDLVARELEKERLALAEDPEEETEELAQLYVERGMPLEQAREMAKLVMQNPELALEVHAREELGVDPHELASPMVAATWSFVAFEIGALLPLIPWFFSSSTAIVWLSVPMSGAGMSRRGPITREILSVNTRVSFSSSLVSNSRGSQVTPPLAPPSGKPVKAVFQVIKEASALTSSKSAVG